MDHFGPVIVADNSSAMASIVTLLVHRCGFKDVKQVYTARSVISLSCDQPPECVIADMSLPDMTGLQLLEYLRNNALLRDTRFILTGNILERLNIDAARRLKADAILLKPVTFDSLSMKLNVMTGSRLAS